jgi:peptidoglycan hydrolase CwlO-like protein
MKTVRTLSAILLVLTIAFAVSATTAQEKMTKDQWQQQMTDLKAKQASLTDEMTKLTADLAGLKTQSDKLDADLRACEDALYALLGVTRADVEAFDKELTDMENRVAELQRMSDAQLVNYREELERMKTRLGEMSQSKITLIPRYAARVAALTEKVDALLKSIVREKSYTVGTWGRDRDCLWNIAKKKDIYANAWMWPKIWQGNRDKIKDPDIIQPRWVLRIPEGKEMTPAEKSAANSYYRKKASGPDGQ